MTTVEASSQRTGTAIGKRLPRAAAFWTVAVLTAALLAASSAPSPLYPILQADYGFSAVTETAIFAIYVITLLGALLTVGRLSDVVGRRPVLAAALVVEAGSMAIFLGADGVGALLAARAVQGLATGAAVGVLGAYLLDLQPRDGSRLGSLVNSAAPSAGLGVGAVLAGVLIQYAPHPTRLVFAVFTVLFVLLAATTAVLPETVSRVPGVAAALRPQVSVPPQARAAFGSAVPAIIASWALGSLMLSVGGALLDGTFGQRNQAVVGLLLAVFAVSGAVAAVAGRDLAPGPMARRGTAALTGGTLVFLLALATSSLAAFVPSVIIAGAGFGTAFLGALRSVTQLAEPTQRAALLSAVYVVSYLAFSIPALVTGVVLTHAGLRSTALGYAGFVAVVAAAAMAIEWRRRAR